MKIINMAMSVALYSYFREEAEKKANDEREREQDRDEAKAAA